MYFMEEKNSHSTYLITIYSISIAIIINLQLLEITVDNPKCYAYSCR